MDNNKTWKTFENTCNRLNFILLANIHIILGTVQVYSKYSWSLNTGLNYMCPLIHGFFFNEYSRSCSIHACLNQELWLQSADYGTGASADSDQQRALESIPCGYQKTNDCAGLFNSQNNYMR